jgi:hypothetical protein
MNILNFTNHKAELESLSKLWVNYLLILVLLHFEIIIEYFKITSYYTFSAANLQNTRSCVKHEMHSFEVVIKFSVWRELPIQFISIYRKIFDKEDDIFIYQSFIIIEYIISQLYIPNTKKRISCEDI